MLLPSHLNSDLFPADFRREAPSGAVLGTLTCCCGAPAPRRPLWRTLQLRGPRFGGPGCALTAAAPLGRAPGARPAVQSLLSRRPADAQLFRPGSQKPERASPAVGACAGRGARLPRDAGLRRGRGFNRLRAEKAAGLRLETAVFQGLGARFFCGSEMGGGEERVRRLIHLCKNGRRCEPHFLTLHRWAAQGLRQALMFLYKNKKGFKSLEQSQCKLKINLSWLPLVLKCHRGGWGRGSTWEESDS